MLQEGFFSSLPKPIHAHKSEGEAKAYVGCYPKALLSLSAAWLLLYRP